MSTVILFILYILISMVFTWKFVDFIKIKQWDIKSARTLLAIFITIIGFLLVSIRVIILGGIEEGSRNEINLTLILGSIIIFVIMLLSLFVMHLVRKMKYVEVNFKIPINNHQKGSLAEDSMTCLVDRDKILNVQKILSIPIDSNGQQMIEKKEEIEILENK